MGLYRKRPVVIEALQFDGSMEGRNALLAWIGSNGGKARHWPHRDEKRAGNGEISQSFDPEHLSIITLEGKMRADLGDWIIRGVAGEFYPCRSDIFEATYIEEVQLWPFPCCEHCNCDDRAGHDEGCAEDADCPGNRVTA